MTQTAERAAGMAALAERYDGLILDLWGVLHDGLHAYPEALDALRHLKARGTRLVVLSNAPRPATSIAAKMADLGITPDLYDHLMSSGEEAHRHLATRPCPWYQRLGRRLYHLGPPHDAVMREGIDAEVVDRVAEADFVLNTGPAVGATTLDAVEPDLHAAAARGLPMICANPDLVVQRGALHELCAGAVARRYEDLGGAVVYHGKPYPRIYETCFALLGEGARARIAAVGDSLRTDVAGAQAVGIDSIFVTSGIHMEALRVRHGAPAHPEALAELFAHEGRSPTAVIPAFRW